jgi:predicted RNase H-like HicB family nuclease
MSDGASYEEALKNVYIIIDEYIDTAKSLGRSIPTLVVNLCMHDYSFI